MLRLHGPLLALAALSMFGCRPQTLAVRLVPPPQPFAALVILPVEVSAPIDAADQERRGQDLLAALAQQAEWRVLGPRAFRLTDELAPDFLHGTDLVLRGRELGFDARQLLFARLRVALHEAHARAAASGPAGAAARSSYDGEVIVTLTLLDADGVDRGEITVREHNDPFAEHADWDDLPAARRAIVRAVEALVGACPGCVAARPALPFAVFVNPAVLLDARDDEGGSLRQTLAAVDALERDRLLWRTMQYLQPAISLEEARRLAAVPPGACVGETPPPGLEAGDCIIAAEGVTVDGPHALAWVLGRAEQVALTVIDTVGSSRIVLYPP